MAIDSNHQSQEFRESKLRDPSQSGPRIVLTDLELSYTGNPGENVAGPLSVEIEPGQTVALVGPSGCGKSSILKSIIGELRPSSGAIKVENKSSKKPKLSVVFQENTVFPWLTAQDNVAYPMRISGSPKRTREQTAQSWLKRFGLVDSVNKYPSELSGGMSQRVALARALAHEPELLVLDEPFGQVDDLTRLDLGLELQRLLFNTNITTLLVTHSIDEAVLLSTRIIVLSKSPARILLDFNNPLSEVRDAHTLTETLFSEARNRVLQTLVNDRE